MKTNARWCGCGVGCDGTCLPVKKKEGKPLKSQFIMLSKEEVEKERRSAYTYAF